MSTHLARALGHRLAAPTRARALCLVATALLVHAVHVEAYLDKPVSPPLAAPHGRFVAPCPRSGVSDEPVTTRSARKRRIEEQSGARGHRVA